MSLLARFCTVISRFSRPALRFPQRRPHRSRQLPQPRQLHLEMLEDRSLPSLLGNPVFPLDNPWNQRVDTAPVAANSATLVNAIGANRALHADFGTTWAGALNGIPYNTVSGTQAKVEILIDAYPEESDLVYNGNRALVPIPANAIIEGDPLASGQNTGDRHLLVYDKDHNVLYEMYNARRPSESRDGRWHVDSLAYWDLKQDWFRPATYTSADAAGLPILPGLVRPEEVYDEGRITHALRFTVAQTQNLFVYPASHQAGSANTRLPRMGERFRLRPDFDISSFSPANQVILTALKEYGMIVADNGGSWFLSGAPSARWQDDELTQLARVKGSDFQAVDLQPRITSATGTLTPGTVVAITGQNFSGGAGYETVYFGSTAAAQVSIVSDTKILATVPALPAGSAPQIYVASPYGNSSKVSVVQVGYEPTALEQLMLEQLNDIRANPAAYGAAIGLDLSNIAPAQPLAFDPRLIQSARLHSQDMNTHNYFSHTGSDGSDPGTRITASGFSWSGWGESIAAGYTTTADALKNLIIDTGIPDLGHRRHLLAIDSIFKNQGQVGIGIVQNGSGYYQQYYTIDTAADASSQPFLTGVVYEDKNRNGRYDLNEGLGGVTITVNGTSTDTYATGGYSLRLKPGTYTITFQGGGLEQAISKQVTLGTANYRLNVTPVVQSPPVLAPLAEQTMSRGQTALTLSLSATDANNDPLTYSATVLPSDPLYNLQQSLALVQHNGSYYVNARGQNEKYLFSNAEQNWYILLPVGNTTQLRKWDGSSIASSPVAATLDLSIWTDPALLLHAAAPTGSVPVTATVSGSTLTISKPAGFTGQFLVRVAVSDGMDSDAQQFLVTVSNAAPVLTTTPADIQASRSSFPKTVAVAASDADGDALTLTAAAEAYSQLYELKQSLGLVQYGGSYYSNARGQKEKYLWSTVEQNWYILLPDSNTANLYRWQDRENIRSNALVTTLDLSVWNNPLLLLNAAAPTSAPAVQFSSPLHGQGAISGELTITPPADFVGTFRVVLTASDGSAATKRSFLVTVTNVAPMITTTPADFSAARSSFPKTVAVAAGDADGDALTLTAAAEAYSQLYELKQSLGLVQYGGSYYSNARGQKEKYLWSTVEQNWYILLPDSSTANLYRWQDRENIRSNALVTTLDLSIWNNPLLLLNAAAPTSAPAVQFSPALSGTGSVSGELTITPPADFVGTFRVVLTASDGSAATKRSFLVTVTNVAPMITTTPADFSAARSSFPKTVAVAAGDADGDALTLTAAAEAYSQLYELKQSLGLVQYGGSYYSNARGQKEKYLWSTVEQNWYILLPDSSTANLYRWQDRENIRSNALVTTLDLSVWSDPLLLLQAAAPTAPAVQFSSPLRGQGAISGELTITPPADFVGTFRVVLTASDGSAATKRSFLVTVTA